MLIFTANISPGPHLQPLYQIQRNICKMASLAETAFLAIMRHDRSSGRTGTARWIQTGAMLPQGEPRDAAV